MQTYELTLKSDVSKSFRCKKAANSLDIDSEKKSVHHFKVDADIETAFNVGLIVGASGSGKTTFAKKLFGEDCFDEVLDLSKPVIEQFDKDYSYDECASMLAGVGLTSVPCWIRPAYTLSNGQRARAEIALQISNKDKSTIIIDEWTSVVDRTVAKVMSHCVQKHARKTQKKIILCSCHYDVEEWLQPDWVIDCNKQLYKDWRGVRRNRKEKLEFEIGKADKSSWRYFSKYHYLSDKLPGGHIVLFGLYHQNEQIGFQCFANYVPHRKGTKMIMHSNRTVVHPDYAGLGMGITLINKTSKIMMDKGYNVMAKFSSTPVFKAMDRQSCWSLQNVQRNVKTIIGGNMKRNGGFRESVKTYSFRFIEDHSVNFFD